MVLNIACSSEKVPEGWREFFEYVRTGRLVEGSKLVDDIHQAVDAANRDEEVRRAMTVEEQMIIEHRNGVYVGRIEEKWNIARKLKEKGLEAELISEVTNLTAEEVGSIDLSQPEA